MHEVGDIIYLLSRKNHKIVPARIESVTTVKKLNGIDITHELSIPGAEPSQKIMLEKLDVEVFQNISELKDHMLKIVRQKVSNDISTVQELIASTWPDKPSPPLENLIPASDFTPNQKKGEGIVKVQLPDGSTANVQMPPELI